MWSVYPARNRNAKQLYTVVMIIYMLVLVMVKLLELFDMSLLKRTSGAVVLILTSLVRLLCWSLGVTKYRLLCQDIIF